MSDNAIVTSNPSGALMPAMSMQDALNRYQSVIEFTRRIMVEGKDFGKIPGAGDKPTLLKPGAEKLSSFFGLAPEFKAVDKIVDFDKGLFYIQYECRLYRRGELVGSGLGSCNSQEKKYRYRQSERVCPACGKATIIKGKAEYGGGWLCFAKKGGCGAKYQDGNQTIEGQQTGQIENPDKADLLNTIDKMAQKRALVAAVLITTNASEFFTQDIEDMVIDGAYVAEVQHQPTPRPEQVITAELGYDAQPTMTLETANDMLNSQGVRYGDVPSEKLSEMTIGIGKALNKPNLTPEQRNTYTMKQDAIKVILTSRNQ